MRRIMCSIVIAILSSGWLFALCLGFSSYMDGVETVLRGNEAANSFPYFEFARDTMTIGFLWGGVAIGSWAFAGVYKFTCNRGK